MPENQKTLKGEIVMKIPAELKYSSDHEWVKVEGNKATIGITDFAQDQLGDVVFVEVPALDTELNATEGLGTIESVKAVSDVYSPVSGKVVEVNEQLEDAPQLINEDAYGKGWICVVELSNTAELDDLLDAADYEKLLLEEA